MSTRLRLTGVAILIPGIILGLLLAAQAPPAMAESPDNERRFAFSLGLKNLLPLSELVPPPASKTTPRSDASPQSSSSTRGTGILPPLLSSLKPVIAPPNNLRQDEEEPPEIDYTIPPAKVIGPGSSRYFDCNAHHNWPHPTGWYYDAFNDETVDMGAWVHTGFDGASGVAICQFRNHEPGLNFVSCSQAPTTLSVLGDGPDRVRFTGQYLLSGTPLCLDSNGIHELEEYAQEYTDP